MGAGFMIVILLIGSLLSLTARQVSDAETETHDSYIELSENS